jgi:hypothetical protein
MGWIRKIQKHEGRDRSGKSKKTRRKEWRKEKEEIFMYMEVPILVCFSSVRNTLVRFSLKRTHSYGGLPYNKIIGTWYKASFLQKEPKNFPKAIFPELTSIQESFTPSIQGKHLFIVTLSHI